MSNYDNRNDQSTFYAIVLGGLCFLILGILYAIGSFLGLDIKTTCAFLFWEAVVLALIAGMYFFILERPNIWDFLKQYGPLIIALLWLGSWSALDYWATHSESINSMSNFLQPKEDFFGEKKWYGEWYSQWGIFLVLIGYGGFHRQRFSEENY